MQVGLSAFGGALQRNLAHATPAKDAARGLTGESIAVTAALLALSAAFAIALSSVILGSVAGRMGLLRLTQVQMVTAFALTGAVATLRGGWATLEGWHLGALALSSASGIMLASLTYVATLRALGPRLTAMLFSMAAPFALALGWLFLSETISLRQGAGVALILTGVVLAVRAGGEGGGRRVSALGICLGLVTALGQAGGSLFARPAMATGIEPFAAMAVRAGLAVVVFAAIGALAPRARGAAPNIAGSGRRNDMGLVILSAALGTGLGMSLLMAALAVGDAGIVTTLSSTTPLLVLPMVWIAGGRRPAALAWAGALLALPGIALIAGL